jgi:hypothetical protein
MRLLLQLKVQGREAKGRWSRQLSAYQQRPIIVVMFVSGAF